MNMNKNTLLEYMNTISVKQHPKITNPKKQLKISDESIVIPNIRTYNDILLYNYTLDQLRTFLRFYKLKVGGAKHELASRLFAHLKLSSVAIKIQGVARGSLVRTYNKLHGPAFTNRKLCTNETDFVSMDSLDEIELDRFISYKDADGFIYGFDLVSLYNLIFKCGVDVKNPYNRNTVPAYVYRNIKSIIRIGTLFNKHINLHIEDDVAISKPKAVELRALELFQKIDSLGNYSDSNWFLSLNRSKSIRFMRELGDIFNFRAQLTNEVKQNICPPHGDPFRTFNMNYILAEEELHNVKNHILEILEKFVNDGIDVNNKSLGAYYILAALTLVNDTAANALPWLFQSVSYF
jgi:hypothetical protein